MRIQLGDEGEANIETRTIPRDNNHDKLKRTAVTKTSQHNGPTCSTRNMTIRS